MRPPKAPSIAKQPLKPKSAVEPVNHAKMNVRIKPEIKPYAM
jgi:hypothetical protein